MQTIDLPTYSPYFKPAPLPGDPFWDGIEVNLHFSIIGAPKSGTSWLFYCLNQHPDIFIPGEQNGFTEFQSKGTKYYYDLYKYTKEYQKLGDYSNSYMLDENLPQIFVEKFPDIKLIIVCRNPVKRAFSHYLMDITSGAINPEKVNFRDALVHPRKYSYYDFGLYHKHISRYLQYISRENILVIITDEIRTSSETVINRTFDFLGVSRITSLTLENINTWQSNRIHRSSLVRTVRKIARSILPGRIRDKAGYYYMTFLNSIANHFVKIPQPTISEADKVWLQEKYYDENRKLETLLGKDLSSWDL